MKIGYLGLDQYGQKYVLKKHPRKELLEQLGASNASKMYRDTKNGDSKHYGYVIQGLWIEILEVHSWKN